MEAKTISGLFSATMAAVFISMFYAKRGRKQGNVASMLEVGDEQLDYCRKRFENSTADDMGSSTRRTEIVEYKQVLMKKIAGIQIQGGAAGNDTMGGRREGKPQQDGHVDSVKSSQEKLLLNLGEVLNFQHPLERMPVILEHYRDMFEEVRGEPTSSEFQTRLADFYFALCMTRETNWYGAADIEVTCYDLVNYETPQLPQAEAWQTPVLVLLKAAYSYCVANPTSQVHSELRLAESSRMYLRALNQRREFLEKDGSTAGMMLLQKEIDYVGDILFAI